MSQRRSLVDSTAEFLHEVQRMERSSISSSLASSVAWRASSSSSGGGVGMAGSLGGSALSVEELSGLDDHRYKEYRQQIFADQGNSPTRLTMDRHEAELSYLRQIRLLREDQEVKDSLIATLKERIVVLEQEKENFSKSEHELKRKLSFYVNYSSAREEIESRFLESSATNDQLLSSIAGLTAELNFEKIKYEEVVKENITLKADCKFFNAQFEQTMKSLRELEKKYEEFATQKRVHEAKLDMKVDEKEKEVIRIQNEFKILGGTYGALYAKYANLEQIHNETASSMEIMNQKIAQAEILLKQRNQKIELDAKTISDLEEKLVENESKMQSQSDELKKSKAISTRLASILKEIIGYMENCSAGIDFYVSDMAKSSPSSSLRTVESAEKKKSNFKLNMTSLKREFEKTIGQIKADKQSEQLISFFSTMKVVVDHAANKSDECKSLKAELKVTQEKLSETTKIMNDYEKEVSFYNNFSDFFEKNVPKYIESLKHFGILDEFEIESDDNEVPMKFLRYLNPTVSSAAKTSLSVGQTPAKIRKSVDSTNDPTKDIYIERFNAFDEGLQLLISNYSKILDDFNAYEERIRIAEEKAATLRPLDEDGLNFIDISSVKRYYQDKIRANAEAFSAEKDQLLLALASAEEASKITASEWKAEVQRLKSEIEFVSSMKEKEIGLVERELFRDKNFVGSQLRDCSLALENLLQYCIVIQSKYQDLIQQKNFMSQKLKSLETIRNRLLQNSSNLNFSHEIEIPKKKTLRTIRVYAIMIIAMNRLKRSLQSKRPSFVPLKFPDICDRTITSSNEWILPSAADIQNGGVSNSFKILFDKLCPRYRGNYSDLITFIGAVPCRSSIKPINESDKKFKFWYEVIGVYDAQSLKLCSLFLDSYHEVKRKLHSLTIECEKSNDEVFQLISQIAQQESEIQKSDSIISNQAEVIDRFERTHYRSNQHIRKFVETTLHTMDFSNSTGLENHFHSEGAAKFPLSPENNAVEEEFYSIKSRGHVETTGDTFGKYSLQFDDPSTRRRVGSDGIEDIISPCSSNDSDELLDVSDEKVRKMYSKLSHMTKKMETTRLNRSSFF